MFSPFFARAEQGKRRPITVQRASGARPDASETLAAKEPLQQQMASERPKVVVEA